MADKTHANAILPHSRNRVPPVPQLTLFTDLNKAHLLFQMEIPRITKSRICL